MTTIRLICAFAVILLVLPARLFADAASYDPLSLSSGSSPQLVELTVSDRDRQREIPVRLFLPRGGSRSPVVLFSHGLGGSGREYGYLGEHWGARGYAVAFLQHPGSDTSVWENKPPSERLRAMQQAASLDNFFLRVKDVEVVLDRLAELDKIEGGPLSGRLDLAHVGMSGHSFGAITTQALSGQATGIPGLSFTDKRICAAVIMSPNNPRRIDPRVSFGAVNIPWMLLTGTHDLVPLLSDADMESRLGVFPALPPGGKYEVVLFNAEHSVFTDRALPGDTRPRNPNHHRAILALTTAFWDAWLSGNPSARRWLDGDGPSEVLEKQDRWQKK